MRRIAAVFAGKRSSKSDAASSAGNDAQTSSTTDGSQPKPSKSRSGFFRSLSRNAGVVDHEPKQQRTHPPPVSAGTDHVYSSSSSSSGGPCTPDDDGGSYIRPASNQSHCIAPIFAERGVPPIPSEQDTDDDTSSEESSGSEPDPSVTPIGPLLSTPMSPSSYLGALTTNALAPPFSPPPLLHLLNSPLFPRSCNTRKALWRHETLESSILRQRLLQHLDHNPLNIAESDEIAVFGSRRRAPVPKRPALGLDDTAVKDAKRLEMFSLGLKRWSDRPCFEDRLVVYMPLEDTGEVVWAPVTGYPGFGVAALEFSEGLEALAGLHDLPEDTEEAMPAFLAAELGSTTSISLSPSPTSISPRASSSSVTALPPSASAPVLLPSNTAKAPAPAITPAQSRPQLYKASPSPLRMEHSSPPPPILTSSTSQASTVVASPAIVASPTVVGSPTSPIFIPAGPSSPGAPQPDQQSQPQPKRGVRFAEEGKDDQLPLGYVLRIKQKREEKARFLQAERARRTHEEEQRKRQEERRKREEARRWQEEERRKQAERERLADEERRQRLYSDELAAARSRRDTQKHKLPREGNVVWEGDREKERERRGREARHVYARPTYDAQTSGGVQTSKRQVTEPAMPASDPRNGSPGSSRPGSINGGAGSGSASGSARGSSRPPSMYSTPPSSANDVRLRERRESRSSHRGSFTSESSQRLTMDMPPYPVAYPWNMTMSPGIPPVPPLPIMPYVMDMPLLPPTAPFMMQQFGHRGPPQQQQQQSRSHSPHEGRSHSSSTSPTKGSPHPRSSSHKSDRVHSRGASPAQPRAEYRKSGVEVGDDRKARTSIGSRSASDDRLGSRSAGGSGGSGHSSPNNGGYSPGQRSSSRQSGLSSSHSPARASGVRSASFVLPQSQQLLQPPTPVLTSHWSQPAFQNLSRPPPNRRQTMIS